MDQTGRSSPFGHLGDSVKMEFETTLSEALTAKVKKFTGGKDGYTDVDMTKALFGLLCLLTSAS